MNKKVKNRLDQVVKEMEEMSDEEREELFKKQRRKSERRAKQMENFVDKNKVIEKLEEAFGGREFYLERIKSCGDILIFRSKYDSIELTVSKAGTDGDIEFILKYHLLEQHTIKIIEYSDTLEYIPELRFQLLNKATKVRDSIDEFIGRELKKEIQHS